VSTLSLVSSDVLYGNRCLSQTTKRKDVNKEREPGMEWVSLRGLLAPFSGEALPDVDEVLA